MLVPSVGFESSIESFEEMDKKNTIKKGGILFYGDSDIGYWRRGDRFAIDFSQFPVVNRGFGGARIWETLIYFKRVILPHEPSVLVYNCGDNDVVRLKGNSSENIKIGFDLFLQTVERQLPDIEKVICLPIHPAPQRNDLELWDHQNHGNQIMKEICDGYSFALFEDYNHLLFDDLNLINENYFLKDRIHYNEDFYCILAKYITPILKKYFKG